MPDIEELWLVALGLNKPFFKKPHMPRMLIHQKGNNNYIYITGIAKVLKPGEAYRIVEVKRVGNRVFIELEVVHSAH